MKRRKKMKPWLIVLIVVFALAALPFLLWSNLFGCHHKLNPVVSVELVSQEAPLVFYQLMEEPKIEGIRVRLTYADGSTEIVNAGDSQTHGRFGVARLDLHEKGMFFRDLGICWPDAPALEPGIHQIPMYCMDAVYPQNFDPENDPHNGDFASCMVEVRALSGEEFFAGPEVNHVTVTPGSEVVVSPKGEGLETKCLLRLLAEESGTYELKIEGGPFLLFSYQYAGSGMLSDGAKPKGDRCNAHLNAGEPLFVPVYPFMAVGSTPMHITLTRLPEE